MNAATLLQDMPVDLGGRPGGPALYQLARVLAGSKPENVYAPPPVTRYHLLRTVAVRTLWSAAAILVLGLGLQAPLLHDLLDSRAQRTVLAARTQPLQRQYEELSAGFPQAEISPAEMELIVQTYDTLDAQSLHPGAGFNLAADALAGSPGLELTSVSWQIEEAPFKAFVDATGATVSAPPAIPGISQNDAFLAALLSNRSRVKMVINGEAYSPSSFREAQDQVVGYIDALDRYSGVSVFASRMPTDVRTDIEVSTTVNDGEVRAPFTLEVVIDPQERATAASAATGAQP
jgi:hypothetical protein